MDSNKLIILVVLTLLGGHHESVTLAAITSRKHIPGAPPFSPELSGLGPPANSYKQNPKNFIPQQQFKQQVSDSKSSNDLIDEQARNAISARDNAAILARARYSFNQMDGWPVGADKFGQISAVATDPAGRVVIFHRDDHKWDGSTFDNQDNYLKESDGPIRVDTILTIDPLLGEIVAHWGSNMFYLPHGLSFDSQGNIWVTDVALHQAFKFPAGGFPNGSKNVKPLMTLGSRFENGKDERHFCKPTSVAVDLASGDIYVADGYCNSRVVRFDQTGKYFSSFGHGDQMYLSPFSQSGTDISALYIPHKIVLLEKDHLACVADREHGRVMCFNYPDGTPSTLELKDERFDGRLFSVAYYAPENVLYAVAGNHLYSSDTKPILAFAFNATTREKISEIVPTSGTFAQPHDIAVSHDGNCVYIVEIGPNNLHRLCRSGYSDAPTSTTPKRTLFSKAFTTNQGIISKATDNPVNNVVNSIVTAFPHSIDWQSGSNSRSLIIALTSVPLVACLILLFVLQCSPAACCAKICFCFRSRHQYRVRPSTARKQKSSLLNGGPSKGSNSSSSGLGASASPIKGWLRSAKREIGEKIRSDPSRDGFRLLASDDNTSYDVEMDDYLAQADEDEIENSNSYSMNSQSRKSKQAQQQQTHRKAHSSRIRSQRNRDSEDDDESDVEQFNASAILAKTKTDRL